MAINYLPADDCTCDLCTRLRVSIFTVKLLPNQKPEAIKATKAKIDHYFHQRQKILRKEELTNGKRKV